ncbi:MAG: RimK-like ATPgrasp N-terminal domain-containing protein, partial [Pseudomonadota bacterium]|nr:RimK-like ATPgrasp N-terminal domain-containing protein [Pseudomonadota bacterium]
MHNTLIVTDDVTPFCNTALTVLTFQEYLADFPKLNEPKTRVINLCDTSRYLSEGYYCSLLAQARSHLVLPTVNTINDLRVAEEKSIDRMVFSLSVQQDNAEVLSEPLLVLFGEVKDQRFKRLARQAFEKYPCPILIVTPSVTHTKVLAKASGKVQVEGVATVQVKAFKDLAEKQQARFIEQLEIHTKKQWRASKASKRTRWDMAILVNPEESTPPSDEKAIKHFVKAAEKAGFRADVVSRLSPEELGHYDALFIRETTAIDHHTYRLARAAEREGIVVMDDTQSILRCCNKVFLQDAFAYQKVPAPKATFVSSATDEVCDKLINDFGLPLVLKLPESSFSRGVHKAENKETLKTRLTQMLAESALVLVQE